MVITTIQLSTELVEKLQKMRMHSKESYENIIWELIEDRMQLSEETKKAIKEYEEDLKKNNWKNFGSMDEMKKRLKINV